jgi:hypothetical protein
VRKAFRTLDKLAGKVVLVVCPWLFTIKIILCAAGYGRIDWWDASFLLIYTFVFRRANKE